jgi:ABC-type nitrate/sulfonate/bicarbonate transport system substrate-binding protein
MCIRDSPEAVLELTKSLVDSGQFIINNTSAAAEIGAKFLSQDVEVIQRVLEDPKQRVTFNELFPVIDDYEFMQNYLTGTISAMSKKIDLEKFVDPIFAKEAGAK